MFYPQSPIPNPHVIINKIKKSLNNKIKLYLKKLFNILLNIKYNIIIFIF